MTDPDLTIQQPALIPLEDPMITVYGQPSCGPCKAAMRSLDKEDVPYTYVDLEENQVKAAELQQAGYLQTPIIESPSGRFAGVQPDRIKAAAVEVRELIATQQATVTPVTQHREVN